ncbi:MAG: Glu/Leu/Phe/Val family dehydrogenase [Acidimicrobiales bacterium]
MSVWRRRTGLRAIVAVHSTVLGPSLGGTRYRVYASEDDALADVLALSEAMTYKSAVAGLALGGGKAVIIGDPAVSKSEALLSDYAEVLNGMGGRYITAEDVGTSQDDMDFLGGRTAHVAGRSTRLGGSGDPSPLTAIGVVCAMEAAAEHRWGQRDLAGRHVAISGMGKVGSGVAALLADRGCDLTISDVVADAVARVADSTKVTVVDPAEIHKVPCDVFAPCALGGVLDASTVPELRCEVVAGGANNQLAGDEVAAMLLGRDILYVPDFVANAGGIINIAHEVGGYDPEAARAHVEGIYDTTSELFTRAAAAGGTLLEAAAALAAERLAAAG